MADELINAAKGSSNSYAIKVRLLSVNSIYSIILPITDISSYSFYRKRTSWSVWPSPIGENLLLRCSSIEGKGLCVSCVMVQLGSFLSLFLRLSMHDNPCSLHVLLAMTPSTRKSTYASSGRWVWKLNENGQLTSAREILASACTPDKVCRGVLSKVSDGLLEPLG